MAQKVKLNEQAEGILPEANGGTGASSLGSVTVGTASVANAIKSATTSVDFSSATEPTVWQVATATWPTSAIWTTPADSFPWNKTVSWGSWVGLSLTMNNSYASAWVGQRITISNTQSSVTTGLEINTGSAWIGHRWIYITIPNASKWILIEPSSTGTWNWIEFNNTGWVGFKWILWNTIHLNGANSYWIYQSSISNASTWAGYGIYQSQIATTASSGNTWYGLYQGIIQNAAGSTAYWIYQQIISKAASWTSVWWHVQSLGDTATAWNTAKFFSLNGTNSWAISARTTTASETIMSRTNTATTGTVADNYNVQNISRTSIQNGAWGTFTSAGSILRLENVATQTAGTLTDSVAPLSLVQSNSSTGWHILFNSYSWTPTTDWTLWFDGSNLKIRVAGVTYTITKA